MVAGACGRGSCPPCGSQEAKDEGGRERPTFQSASYLLLLARAHAPTVGSAVELTDEFISELTYS